MMMTVEFLSQNVTQGKLASPHALDLETLYSVNATDVAQAVNELYANQHKEGAWSAWLNLPHRDAMWEAMTAFAQEVEGQFDDLVILGIGGSCLGGKTLLSALLHPYWNNLTKEQRGGKPRYHFIDNVDSDQITGLLDVLDLSRTLVNVITKSGTTAETMSAMMLFKEALQSKLGADAVAKHMVVTTDANKGLLRQLAQQAQYRAFEVPDDVGGRFSVFCAVGLLPAALCGIDLQALRQGILDLEPALKNPDVHQNPAAQSALIHTSMYHKGYTQSVLMPYSARLYWVAHWYVQLWAESLGKKFNKEGQVVHVGATAIPAVGATDQHSQIQLYNEGTFDKVITFIEVSQTDHTLTIPATAYPEVAELSYLGGKTFHQLMLAELDGTRTSLLKNDRPTLSLKIPRVDAYHVAQVLYFLEVQTALAGAFFNVDPFDQPGVELAKKYTHALMGKTGYESLLAELA
ncbi:MAG: glucose-6-phosphate isomerase [Vampirovibrionales bacterium]